MNQKYEKSGYELVQSGLGKKVSAKKTDGTTMTLRCKGPDIVRVFKEGLDYHCDCGSDLFYRNDIKRLTLRCKECDKEHDAELARLPCEIMATFNERLFDIPELRKASESFSEQSEIKENSKRNESHETGFPVETDEDSIANDKEKAAYIQASNEVDTSDQDKGLWIKALAMSKGDKSLARHEYVSLRAVELTGTSDAAIHKQNRRLKWDRLNGAFAAIVVWLAIVFPISNVILLFARWEMAESSISRHRSFMRGVIDNYYYNPSIGGGFALSSVLVLICSILSAWAAYLLMSASGRISIKRTLLLVWLSHPVLGLIIMLVSIGSRHLDGMAEIHFFVPLAVAITIAIYAKKSKTLKAIFLSSPNALPVAQVAIEKATFASGKSSETKTANGLVTEHAEEDLGSCASSPENEYYVDSSHDQVKTELSTLTPKKAWAFYFVPWGVALIAGFNSYQPMVDVANGIAMITFLVALLVSFGRLGQSLLKRNSTYFKAACIWAIIPTFHIALTALLVYSQQ